MRAKLPGCGNARSMRRIAAADRRESLTRPKHFRRKCRSGAGRKDAELSGLYNFAAPPDGSEPAAGLIGVGGILYGTTSEGGTYGEVGTVFTVTTTGGEKVSHSFGAAGDGSYPFAALIDVNGTLYGTTQGDITDARRRGRRAYSGEGAVFRITTSGREKELHVFDGNP